MDNNFNIHIHNFLFIYYWKGFQMKPDIRDVLFWIFLILGIILLVWTVFGNSPTEFIALVTIMFTVLLKVWKISDRQIKMDTEFKGLKHSFIRLADDFKQHINK